ADRAAALRRGGEFVRSAVRDLVEAERTVRVGHDRERVAAIGAEHDLLPHDGRLARAGADLAEHRGRALLARMQSSLRSRLLCGMERVDVPRRAPALVGGVAA